MAKARAKSKSKVAKKKVEPLPKGYHSVNPTLVVKGAAEAIRFYESAFGAKELSRSQMPGSDLLMHAELKLGDSIVMLTDEFPEMKCFSPQSVGGASTNMYTYVKDVDKVFDQAINAGATQTMPVTDMFWGDRMGTLVDPFGHVWSLATRKRNLSRKQMQEAAQQWAASMNPSH